MLGMIVTALVTGAIAAMLSAVAQGWTQSNAAGNSSNRVMMTHLRIQNVLRGVKQLGACRPGTLEGTEAACVLIWKADTNLDYKVQFSELAMLELTPSDGKLRYYEVNYPSSWNSGQVTAADTPALASDDIYRDDVDADPPDSAIEDFRDAEYVTATVLAEGISGGEFHKYDGYTTARPRFEYLLNFTTGSTTETEYGSVAVRTPATLPSSKWQ